ncbi:MAG: hypothetical protein ACTIMJ_07430 [Weissella hellenica]|uniref:hypothetical protein n=1 Tax=Weissella hellenica TaxID=46256 RepID=UPI003F9A9AF0
MKRVELMEHEQRYFFTGHPTKVFIIETLAKKLYTTIENHLYLMKEVPRHHTICRHYASIQRKKA